MIESPLLSHLMGYIDGKWVAADSGETLPVSNPADGTHLADIPKMGRAETLRAVDAGAVALGESATLEQRAQWLRQITEALYSQREEIGRILTMEHGKPWKEAQAEVDYAAGFFRFSADHIDQLGPRTLEERPRNCRWSVAYRPAGVVGLITPWNFPIGMIAKKLSAALAADCACIIKPSAKTPLTMIALFSLLHRELDLPPGKVNLITGPAREITDALFEHPAVRVISFTGSTEIGQELIRKSADGIKRLTLELGGNAPYIVFEDADLEQAADNLIANKFRGGGQTCVCANRVFVHRDVADSFADKVVQRVNQMRVGNGLDEGTNLGPLIDDTAVAKVRRHVEDAVSKGARRLAGGDTTGLSGSYYPPTVLIDVPKSALCNREETFGPLVPITTFHDENEVVRAANDTDAGLAAYVFSGDLARARRVAEQLQFGHVGLNTGTGPTPEAPFGGMKCSGYGREGGIEGLHEFAEAQTLPSPE